MKKSLVLLITILAIFIAGMFWWQNGNLPVNKESQEQKTFVIAQGDNVRAIAYNLKTNGLIRDPIVFFLITKQSGLDKKIQAGSFRLSPSMTAAKIAESLTHGTLDIWVTIPEGFRATQIAEVLKENMPGYEDSWISELEKNEGYLFPDTYLFPKDANAANIVSIMMSTFENRYSSIITTKSNLSKEEIVILASLIEREAKHQEDRAIVSSVIHNRLGIGMKLDIDATIQYAKGKIDGKWWRPISTSDYSLSSSYNTYRINGLPPAPISNPGLASLKAAVNPANTDYFYYITDKSGTNRYAKTLEEQEANIEKYGLSD